MPNARPPQAHKAPLGQRTLSQSPLSAGKQNSPKGLGWSVIAEQRRGSAIFRSTTTVHANGNQDGGDNMAFGNKATQPNDDPRLQEGAYMSHNGKLYRNAGQLAAIDYPATNGAEPVQELWKLEDAMSYGHDVHGELLHEIITVTRTELLAQVQQPNTIGAPLVPAYRLEREAPKPDPNRVDGLEHLDRELDQHLAHSAVKNGAGRF